ncbi:MAG TPA: hypothetical protein PKD92_01780, partial [Novosphingobium sp.]|nr:hypothetical protein [Novosphingobium sp.]
MRVAIRADASRVIGSGHIMRCLTLADHLAEAGAEICLLSRNMPPHLAQLTARSGHALIPLEPVEDQ